jgi:hypothetical protein
MNERIRLLAEQATSFDFGGERGFDGVNPRELFDKEKFAQLIVRECAIIARSTKREVDVDGGAVMRNHFGVDK